MESPVHLTPDFEHKFHKRYAKQNLWAIIRAKFRFLAKSLFHFINRLWAQYLIPVIDNIQDEFNARCQSYCQVQWSEFPLWELGFWILLQQHELVKVVTGEERVPTEVYSNIYLT
jgi:hypothetical protein